jgi:hypothetical protein
MKNSDKTLIPATFKRACLRKCSSTVYRICSRNSAAWSAPCVWPTAISTPFLETDDLIGGIDLVDNETGILWSLRFVRQTIARFDQQGRGLANASINRSISALRRMFNLTLEDGTLREIPHFPMLKEATQRQGFFERELRVLLKEQFAKRQPECPYVCFRIDRNGRSVKIKSFRKSWYSACVKAGLGEMVPAVDSAGQPVHAPLGGQRSNAKQVMTYKGMIFHDLRRTAVRNLVAAGVPEKVAQTITGHRTRSAFDRYHIVSQKDVSEAGRKLAIFHGENVRGTTRGQFARTQSRKCDN